MAMPADSRDRYFQTELRMITRKLASLEGKLEYTNDRLRKYQNNMGNRVSKVINRIDYIEALLRRIMVHQGINIPLEELPIGFPSLKESDANDRSS